jgi:hypothetical protein
VRPCESRPSDLCKIPCMTPLPSAPVLRLDEHMFQRPSRALHALLSLVDDVLADPFDAGPPHPHRRPLRWQRPRRAGSVPAPPAYCVSPVRSAGSPRVRESARRLDRLAR